MHQPNPSTDPQLIQADTDGMIDRRENRSCGHCGASHGADHDGECPLHPAWSSRASQDEADSGTEQDARHALQFARFQNLSSDRARAEWGISNYDNHSSMGEFAIALLRPVDHLGVQLRVFTDATAALRAFLTSDAMDPLATCYTPEEVENTLQAAGLRDARQQPSVGTRVKRLIQPAGDLGTVVGWHHELQLPEIEWDSQRGLPAEACEPHELTTDLNEQIDRWR
jgi:hypothetical protein